jgi:predicted RNA binding protein YcfA (HicA-like mRNA interferase family)
VKFREFISILNEHGFAVVRQSGSHAQYEGFVDGQRRLVTVAAHRMNDDILPGTLASMIRQSGLPKQAFR